MTAPSLSQITAAITRRPVIAASVTGTITNKQICCLDHYVNDMRAKTGKLKPFNEPFMKGLTHYFKAMNSFNHNEEDGRQLYTIAANLFQKGIDKSPDIDFPYYFLGRSLFWSTTTYFQFGEGVEVRVSLDVSMIFLISFISQRLQQSFSSSPLQPPSDNLF